MYLLESENEQSLISIPDKFTKTMFVCGLASLAYLSSGFIRRSLGNIYAWYRSFGNARMKLTIEHDPRHKKQK